MAVVVQDRRRVVSLWRLAGMARRGWGRGERGTEDRRCMVAGVLLVLSLIVLLAGALVFTNAIEWAGVRLNLGHSAVGSVLAAAATALPESLIPLVAVVSGSQSDEIA